MGKISRIQLRGISRTPSDRLTADGGVAESLNMYIEQEESAPALTPVDVTDELGLPDDLVADRVFVHKTASYENIILYDAFSGEVSACINKQIVLLHRLERGLQAKFASVGNTLLISTDKAVNYYLFKDNSYKHLGSQIPFPTIRFTAKYADDVTLYERKQESYSIKNNGDTTVGDSSNFWLKPSLYTKDNWNETNATTEEDKEHLGTQKVNVVCKELALQLYKSAKEQKVFVDHVFVRYAVTLYDDSVISSVPYMMAGGYEDPLFLRYTKRSYDWYKTFGESIRTETYEAYNDEVVICKARYPYRIEAKLIDDLSIFDQWIDLIKSIDIYISEKREPTFDNVFATTCVMQGTGEHKPSYNYGKGDPIISQGMTYYEHLEESQTNLFLSIGGPVYQSEFINRELEKGLFYKLETVAYKESGEAGYASFLKRMQELSKGAELDATDYFENYDELVSANKVLSNDDMLHSEILWSQVSPYNNSLLASGVYEMLGTGSTLMAGAAVDIEAMTALSKNATLEGMFSYVNPALLPPENYTVTTPLTYTYIIEENGVEYVVRGRNEKGETLFVDNDFSYYGWVVFPHRNCKKVIVGTDYGYYLTLSMKQHPMLDCSYAYIGLTKNIAETLSEWGDEMDVPQENRKINKSNRIYTTTIDNPFYYPKEGIITFQSSVLGVAIATTALSQGQFGQFPLYVFTEDGIWAMETAADGSFVTSKPLSRDVCINPDSITSIDNAVVFVTDKGVMLLQGSQVVNISPNMNGRHYTIEGAALAVIEGQEFFKDFIPVLTDKTHFMAFVKDATIAYDYSGKRLVFIKKDEKYQYIYKIDTNTWHKTAYGTDVVASINSYPECLVQGKREVSNTYAWITRWESQMSVQEVKDYLLRIFSHKNLDTDVVERFLTEEVGLNVTGWHDDDLDMLYDNLDDFHIYMEYREQEVNATRIYNLSTPLDVESREPVKGVIVTRPFDLEAPDVLKTITDIKVRGQYTRGAVKYILLGSMDGVNFYVIGTKRGKAWKLFRLIILADLDPTERVSWVDVIFEERFTNRLR